MKATMVVLAALVCLSGCGSGGSDKGQSRTADQAPTNQPEVSAVQASTIPEPDQATTKIEKILSEGGVYWSSVSSAQVGGEKYSSGDRFWIWPVEEEMPAAVGGILMIEFHWRVRPGQKPLGPTNDEFVGSEVTGTTPGTVFRAYSPVEGMVPGASEGRAKATFSLRDYRGQGKILFFLSTPRSETRVPSNILSVKAKFSN